jgi:hypothetical protein
LFTLTAAHGAVNSLIRAGFKFYGLTISEPDCQQGALRKNPRKNALEDLNEISIREHPPACTFEVEARDTIARDGSDNGWHFHMRRMAVDRYSSHGALFVAAPKDRD